MTTASSSLNPAAVTTGPSRERICLWDFNPEKERFVQLQFENTVGNVISEEHYISRNYNN